MEDLLSKKHLVIGLGEVGSAILRILKEKFSAEGIDKNGGFWGEKFDVIHVCFPFQDESDFLATLKVNTETWLKDGGLVIIHSTVPIGISERANAVHSPVRGVHPQLYEGIKTFTKFFGGKRAEEASLFFKELGIKTEVSTNSSDTEALKLFDTLYYGWNILFEKEVFDYCKKNKLDFNLVYTLSNETYNNGYRLLSKENVIRPVLKQIDGKIGGHCVIENSKLLSSWISELLQKKNEGF